MIRILYFQNLDLEQRHTKEGKFYTKRIANLVLN